MIYPTLTTLAFLAGLITGTSGRKVPGARFALQIQERLNGNDWPVQLRNRQLTLTVIPWPHHTNTLALDPKEKSTSYILVARVDPFSEVLNGHKVDYDFVQPQQGQLSWQLGMNKAHPELQMRFGITDDLNVPWGYTDFMKEGAKPSDGVPHFGQRTDEKKAPGWLRPPGISPKKNWRWQHINFINVDSQTNHGLKIQYLKYPKGTWVVCNMPIYNAGSAWQGGAPEHKDKSGIDVAEVFYSFDGISGKTQGCKAVTIRKVPRPKNYVHDMLGKGNFLPK